jgi:hypothetical protein
MTMTPSRLTLTTRLPLLALAFSAALAAAGVAGQPAAAAYKDATWEDLVPKDWDPLKKFRDAKVAGLSDADPKVVQLMNEMRAAWDNAPTVPTMDGAAIKLPGYVVPLEEVKGELKEFLLVPYFGACIHTPPPPANQIIHVVMDKPVKGVRSMDAVWASGTLAAARRDTAMGTSGYSMRAAAVVPYTAPAAKP